MGKTLQLIQASETSFHIAEDSWSKDQFQHFKQKFWIQEEKIHWGSKENDSMIAATNQEERNVGTRLKVDDCLVLLEKWKTPTSNLLPQIKITMVCIWFLPLNLLEFHKKSFGVSCKAIEFAQVNHK